MILLKFFKLVEGIIQGKSLSLGQIFSPNAQLSQGHKMRSSSVLESIASMPRKPCQANAHTGQLVAHRLTFGLAFRID